VCQPGYSGPACDIPFPEPIQVCVNVCESLCVCVVHSCLRMRFVNICADVLARARFHEDVPCELNLCLGSNARCVLCVVAVLLWQHVSVT
jgi:hypothetical protein